MGDVSLADRSEIDLPGGDRSLGQATVKPGREIDPRIAAERISEPVHSDSYSKSKILSIDRGLRH